METGIEMPRLVDALLLGVLGSVVGVVGVVLGVVGSVVGVVGSVMGVVGVVLGVVGWVVGVVGSVVGVVGVVLGVVGVLCVGGVTVGLVVGEAFPLLRTSSAMTIPATTSRTAITASVASNASLERRRCGGTGGCW
jgi:hypothetical protein